MEKIELWERNKNKILNSGIIVLALFISFQVYKINDEQFNILTSKKNNELKRNKVTKEIADLEKKIERYKKAFVEKDMSSIVEAISNIARSSSVKIVSMKPIKEGKSDDYVKSSFLIIINSPGYHALGNFISQIEANKDIYLVDEIDINSVNPANTIEGSNTGLSVNLKISAISY